MNKWEKTIALGMPKALFNPEIHHRRSVRLVGFDYSRPGYYFVTICLNDVRCMLAVMASGGRHDIGDDVLPYHRGIDVGVQNFEPLQNKKLFQLTPIGEIAKRYWLEIPHHYPKITSDEFVIMPDHVHGILKIRDVNRQQSVGVQNFEPLPPKKIPPHSKSPSKIHERRHHAFQHTLPDSIGSIIRAYKSSVTMWCRRNGFPQFKWQRSFHDRIIRDEKSLFNIRQYIRNNPGKWLAGSENHLMDELKTLHPDREMSA
jgi:putative transposase